VKTKPPPEKIRLPFVTDESGGTPADWRESPVLLLGDSHTLVFHAGEDMHGTGAGLADQLALELGFPVDVVGVRGSGATPARINLFRRKDNMAGKKLVIWCFSAREFTEAAGGWRLVPVIGSK
jgi:alginate O-acetyltransferase complex protein AlgJ